MFNRWGQLLQVPRICTIWYKYTVYLGTETGTYLHRYIVVRANNLSKYIATQNLWTTDSNWTTEMTWRNVTKTEYDWKYWKYWKVLIQYWKVLSVLIQYWKVLKRLFSTDSVLNRSNLTVRAIISDCQFWSPIDGDCIVRIFLDCSSFQNAGGLVQNVRFVLPPGPCAPCLGRERLL